MKALLVICLTVVAVSASSLNAPTVTTAQGVVEGAYEQVLGQSVAAFRGIPYASPPTGPRRWKPPAPAPAWSGTYAATSDSQSCIQWGTKTLFGQSEDCLYLNVFTKNVTPGEPAPVLFWLYGGSLILGSVSMYGSIENMVALADTPVVLVAPNYRLNSFGFLALEELSKTDPRGTSGNMGFLDQQAALRWVQDNIKSFGGDPSRVTIYGQSSGGTSILSLLASPGSKGLFNGAITLSGSPNISMSLGTAEQFNRNTWLHNVGCDSAPDVLACMYNLTALEVVAGNPPGWDPETQFPPSPSGTQLPGLAIVDGVTVTMPVAQALATGLVPDVSIIFATMRDEDDFGANATRLAWTQPEFEEFCVNHFAPWSSSTGAGIAELYKDVPTGGQAFYDLDADIAVGCGNTVLTQQALKSSPNVYRQVSVHGPAAPGGFPFFTSHMTMPFHMWDVIAAHRTWDMLGDPYSPEPSDIAYGDVLRKAWVSLATNGTIRPELGWKAYTTANHETAVVSSEITVVNGYKDATCEKLTTFGVALERDWWTN